MKTLIILNQNFEKNQAITRIISEQDLVICTDGGYQIAQSKGIKPDLLLGDMDSFDIANTIQPTCKILKIEDQNTTDLEKALLYCEQQGYSDITILGGTGGRADHELYHFHLLHQFRNRLDIRMVTSSQIISGITKKKIFVNKTNPVSFFGFPEAVGVTTRGFRYPLRNAVLSFQQLQSISNEIQEIPAHISIKKGFLILFTSIPGNEIY